MKNKDHLFKQGNKAAEKWTEEEAIQLGEDVINWLKAEDENIFFSEYIALIAEPSKYRGKLNADIIGDLSAKYASFSELIKKCKEIQRVKIVKYATFDKINIYMSKFLLINHHGYLSERQLAAQTEEKPAPVQINLIADTKILPSNEEDVK